MAHHRRDNQLSGRSRKITRRAGLLRGIEKRLKKLVATKWPRAPRMFDKLDPRRAALIGEIFELINRLR
jgi:hypothetical protein